MNIFTKVNNFKSNHVTKYIFENKHICIESVLYEYQDRTVICISTQCGCPIGCIFCGTGKKFIKNLTWDEIIEQVNTILSNHIPNPRLQIMFMSMGEPFLNYNQVSKSIEILHTQYPTAELLISSMAPDKLLDTWNNFINLSTRINKIGLQFSMHSLNSTIRNTLIPFKNKLEIPNIISKSIQWHNATNRPVYLNFILNESNKIQLCNDIQRMLNGNENIFHLTFSVECPLNNQNYKPFNINTYNYMEQNLNKFNIRMFNPEGQDDIGAGCGQLWYVQNWMKNQGNLKT